MDSYSQLNEVLVHLFNHTMKIEEDSLIRDEFKDISINEKYVVDRTSRRCDGGDIDDCYE